MPFGPVQEGLAARMDGGAPAPPGPPQAMPPPGPGGQMMAAGPPPGMAEGDPVQELAMLLGEARTKIGQMGPERFALEGKEVLRGFIGSVTDLQDQMAGGAQAGPQGMPPGPGAPPQGPPPGPPGYPPGP